MDVSKLHPYLEKLGYDRVGTRVLPRPFGLGQALSASKGAWQDVSLDWFLLRADKPACILKMDDVRPDRTRCSPNTDAQGVLNDNSTIGLKGGYRNDSLTCLTKFGLWGLSALTLGKDEAPRCQARRVTGFRIHFC
jgi:hypothetical protein